MRRGIVGPLIAMGFLGLLVAGFTFIQMPILKWSGPNAFEVIERLYIDFERVDHDAATREQYDSYKWYIMGNEPKLWSALHLVRMVGIAFSLVVSLCCFGLAAYLSRRSRADVDPERRSRP